MLTNHIEITDYKFARAQVLVDLYHKHNIKPQGHKFTLAAFRNRELDEFDFGGAEDLRSCFAIKDILDNDIDLESMIQEPGMHNVFYDIENDRYIYSGSEGNLEIEIKPQKILNGVAIVGRPVSRFLDDGETLEITRICFVDEADADEFDVQLHTKNSNHSSPIPSMLVAEICKRAKAMGYKKIITYTRTDECGSYLKATGFQVEHTQPRVYKWRSKNGHKVNTKSTPCPKNRWIKYL